MKKIVAILLMTTLTGTVFAQRLGKFEDYKVDPATRKLVAKILKADKEGKPLEFPNPNKGVQWFPEAGFGLFIHWGIHAVEGRNPSWSMRSKEVKDRKAEINKYYAQADQFNPKNYDPDKWLAAAKKAGFTYAVLTTKHHDGYALWPSKFGGLSTRTHMKGRDLIKPYVEACRKHDMKVGFYFSPRDWHYPDFAGFAAYNMPYSVYIKGGEPPVVDQEKNQAAFEEFYAYTIGQLKELMTNYGEINQIWFDGVRWPGADIHTSATLRWLRSVQPHILLSNNWDDRVRPVLGDYRYNRPPKKSSGITWWEVPARWKGNWGWDPEAPPIETTAWVLNNLSTIRGKGGNFLLNMGPSPDGTMPKEYYKACEELAGWMKHSRESVIGTKGVPKGIESNVPITVKGDKWYLHGLPYDVEVTEFEPREKEIEVTGIKKPNSVKLLKTGQDLDYEYDDDTLIVIIPVSARGRYADVVVVE